MHEGHPYTNDNEDFFSAAADQAHQENHADHV